MSDCTYRLKQIGAFRAIYGHGILPVLSACEERTPPFRIYIQVTRYLGVVHMMGKNRGSMNVAYGHLLACTARVLACS